MKFQLGTHCRTLSSLGICLVEATVGCPALIDLTYVHINGVIGADVAYAVCGLTPYVTAIGNAQRALFGAVSVMPSDEYDTPADTVTPTPGAFLFDEYCLMNICVCCIEECVTYCILVIKHIRPHIHIFLIFANVCLYL